LDKIEKVVKEAGGTIKTRGTGDFIVNIADGRKAHLLVPALRELGYHLFSSIPGSMTITGREYWFQKFPGTAAAWQSYLDGKTDWDGEKFMLGEDDYPNLHT
jgi:hypothetical protein